MSIIGVLKGSLLGIGIFIAAILLYGFGRLAYAIYLTTRAIKAGAFSTLQHGSSYDLRSLTMTPVLWITLAVALAIGLWITRNKSSLQKS